MKRSLNTYVPRHNIYCRQARAKGSNGGRFRKRYRYNVDRETDCFSYALSKLTGEPLLFKGNDCSETDIGAVAGLT